MLLGNNLLLYTHSLSLVSGFLSPGGSFVVWHEVRRHPCQSRVLHTHACQLNLPTVVATAQQHPVQYYYFIVAAASWCMMFVGWGVGKFARDYIIIIMLSRLPTRCCKSAHRMAGGCWAENYWRHGAIDRRWIGRAAQPARRSAYYPETPDYTMVRCGVITIIICVRRKC